MTTPRIRTVSCSLTAFVVAVAAVGCGGKERQPVESGYGTFGFAPTPAAVATPQVSNAASSTSSTTKPVSPTSQTPVIGDIAITRVSGLPDDFVIPCGRKRIVTAPVADPSGVAAKVQLVYDLPIGRQYRDMTPLGDGRYQGDFGPFYGGGHGQKLGFKVSVLDAAGQELARRLVWPKWTIQDC